MTDECPSCVPDGRRGCVLCDHTGRVPADVTPYTVEAWRERALRAEQECADLTESVAIRNAQLTEARRAENVAQDREDRALRFARHARFMAAGWRRLALRAEMELDDARGCAAAWQRLELAVARRQRDEARVERDRLLSVAAAASRACAAALEPDMSRRSESVTRARMRELARALDALDDGGERG